MSPLVKRKVTQSRKRYLTIIEKRLSIPQGSPFTKEVTLEARKSVFLSRNPKEKNCVKKRSERVA